MTSIWLILETSPHFCHLRFTHHFPISVQTKKNHAPPTSDKKKTGYIVENPPPKRSNSTCFYSAMQRWSQPSTKGAEVERTWQNSECMGRKQHNMNVSQETHTQKKNKSTVVGSTSALCRSFASCICWSLKFFFANIFLCVCVFVLLIWNCVHFLG